MVTHKVGNILLHLDKRTKGENTVYKKIVILLLLVGVTFAQEKIGVVFSEKIRLDFEEFNEVEQQLQLDLQVIQKEYQTMAVELDNSVRVLSFAFAFEPIYVLLIPPTLIFPALYPNAVL